jgi:hypothetical protein
MATSSYVRNLLTPTLEAVARCFDYVLSDLRVGRVHPGESLQTRGGNLQWYPLSATTPAVADTEFSIRHGLKSAPYLLVPALPLDGAGGQLVPLTVTRPADGTRVYVSSPVTDAVVTFFVEG